jgi:excisionase family DNA binding protein
VTFFITVPEAAKALGLNRNHLWKLIRAGKVPHYRFSSHAIRVDLKEIQAAFHSRPKNPSAAAEHPGELAEGV